MMSSRLLLPLEYATKNLDVRYLHAAHKTRTIEVAVPI